MSRFRSICRYALPVCAMSFLISCAQHGRGVVPQPPVPSDLLVARSDPGGGFVLRTGLRKIFEDGGTIESFAIESGPEDVFLTRSGKDSRGLYRTEWIPLIRRGDALFLSPQPVWYYVCSLSECMGCRPNTERTSCECPDGAECVFGISQDLFPTEVLGQQGIGGRD